MEEMEFRTGQAILVRNLDNDYWCLANFSHYAKREDTVMCCVVGGNEFVQYMPYKGNGRFLGKKDNPKKEDLPIETPVMACNYPKGNNLNDWIVAYYAGNKNIWIENKPSSERKHLGVQHYEYIVPVDKFDFSNPKNNIPYNVVK